MGTDPIGNMLCKFYLLVKKKRIDVEGNNSKGHLFEDETSEQVYYIAREEGLEPNPPRMTLQLPTISGNLHQFDASFRCGNKIFAIECKNTKIAAKDYVYYFNAKLLDYIFAMEPDERESGLKGIFLSTIPLSKSAWLYSLAYGIRAIDPVSPPVEKMISNVHEDEPLKMTLTSLLEKINEASSTGKRLGHWTPSQLLDEYRFLCTRWRDAYGN